MPLKIVKGSKVSWSYPRNWWKKDLTIVTKTGTVLTDPDAGNMVEVALDEVPPVVIYVKVSELK